MRELTDHTGRKIRVPDAPQRIISLCPSQTATLVALGIGERLAGITRFCVFPEEAWKNTPKVGGTKTIQMDKIDALNPDLIICEKEENTLEIVNDLAQKYPVYVTDVENLEDAYIMTETLGMLTGTEAKAGEINNNIRKALSEIQPLNGIEVGYFIWREPYRVAGRSTFIHSVLELCGFQNLFTGFPDRYPVVTEKQMKSANPQVVFLSSEPYPFSGKHKEEFQLLLPQAQIILVEGEFFSWYGSRMLEAGKYLKTCLSSIEQAV